MIHKGAIILGFALVAVAGVLFAPEKCHTTRAKLKKEGEAIKINYPKILLRLQKTYQKRLH